MTHNIFKKERKAVKKMAAKDMVELQRGAGQTSRSRKLDDKKPNKKKVQNLTMFEELPAAQRKKVDVKGFDDGKHKRKMKKAEKSVAKKH